MDLTLQGTASSVTSRTVETDVLVFAVAASNRDKTRDLGKLWCL